ncbi:MAG: hypothetical protein RL112_2080 [Planctomycetota bacterium]
MSLLRPLACAAALCAIVLARPAHLDHAWSSAVLLAGYLVFVVALPGLLLRAKFAPDDDLLERATFGLATGLVLHLAAAELCLRLWDPTMAWLPCVLVGAACWRASSGVPPRASWWWLALAGAAALRAHHRDPELRPADYDPDLLWHAGNAAEYLRGPLMQDPRVAGLAFDYHVHAYALPAVAARTLGLGVASTTMSLLASLVPVLVVLSAAMLARRLAGAKAGVAAGLALLFACDPALAMRAIGVAGAEAWRSNAFFEAGLWNSPTTALGLLLFIATLERVRALLRASSSGGARFSIAVQVVVGAWAMAGAKGSTAPVLVAGLAAGGAWLAWRARAVRQGLFLASFLALLGAAPTFARLGGSADGYAQSMFRVEPFAAFVDAASVQASGLGWPQAWILFPAWLFVFAGPALAWAVRGAWHPPRDQAVEDDADFRSALWGCALAGFGAALLVSAAGASQLFFAYNSIACLAVLGGVALASTGLAFAALVATPFFLCGAARLAAQAQHHARGRVASGVESRRWFDDVRLLREQSSERALLVSRGETLLLSAYAERRVALETPRFTPRWHAARRAGRDPREPFLELAQEAAGALSGDDGAMQALLRRSGASEAWLVVDGARLVEGRPAFAGGCEARKATGP